MYCILYRERVRAWLFLTRRGYTILSPPSQPLKREIREARGREHRIGGSNPGISNCDTHHEASHISSVFSVSILGENIRVVQLPSWAQPVAVARTPQRACPPRLVLHSNEIPNRWAGFETQANLCSDQYTHDSAKLFSRETENVFPRLTVVSFFPSCFNNSWYWKRKSVCSAWLKEK